MRHIILISGVSVCILLVVLLYKLNKTKMEYDSKFITMNRKVRDLTNLIDLSHTKSKLLGDSVEAPNQTPSQNNTNNNGVTLEKEYETFVSKNENFFGNLDNYDIPENVKTEIDNFVSNESNENVSNETNENVSNETNENVSNESNENVSNESNENVSNEENTSIDNSISEAFNNYNFDDQTIQMGDVVDVDNKAEGQVEHVDGEEEVESQTANTVNESEYLESEVVDSNYVDSHIDDSNLNAQELENVEELETETLDNEDLEINVEGNNGVEKLTSINTDEMEDDAEVEVEVEELVEEMLDKSLNTAELSEEPLEPESQLDFGKLDDLSVKELQEICRSNKLKIKGRKDELVSRIKSNLIVNNL